MDRLLAAASTLGPVGRLPAPGTAGSLAALAAGIALLQWGHGALALALAAAALAAFPAIGAHYRLTGRHDAGEVVIDEVVGQWLAMLVLPAPGTGGFWFWALAAFALFRLLDIAKPGPVGWAERLPGAAGVVADDVAAGALAGAAVWAGAAYFG